MENDIEKITANELLDEKLSPHFTALIKPEENRWTDEYIKSLARSRGYHAKNEGDVIIIWM